MTVLATWHERLELGRKQYMITSLAYVDSTKKTRKVDGLTFAMLEMVIVSFYIEKKIRKACFFQETFLGANTYMKVILGMLFLILSNIDIVFAEKKLTWRSYPPMIRLFQPLSKYKILFQRNLCCQPWIPKRGFCSSHNFFHLKDVNILYQKCCGYLIFCQKVTILVSMFFWKNQPRCHLSSPILIIMLLI